MALIPTQRPGEFIIPELGRAIQLTEWEEMDIYDTMALPAATALAGNTLTYYTGVENRRAVDTNLKTSSKMPARHELIVMKPSVFVLPMWGTAIVELADQLAFYSEGTYELNKNSKPQVSRTHMWRLQSGYGFVAYGLNVAAPGAPVAPSSLGVASPAAIPPLLIPFVIQPEDDFDVRIVFEASRAGVVNNAGAAAPVFATRTTAAAMAIKVFLHGFVKSPGSK